MGSTQWRQLMSWMGIGSLGSSKPVTCLPVYATSIEQFQTPSVLAKMLNRLCRDHDLLAEVNFLRDNKIGILIGADAFLATVPRHFTTGKPGTPYGVNTMLGWTLTGPVPQEYFQTNNKGSSNQNITLFNHLRRGSDDPDEKLLHHFGPLKVSTLVRVLQRDTMKRTRRH